MRVLISLLWTSACLLSRFVKAADLPALDSRCPPHEDPFNPTHLAFYNDCTKFYKCSGGYAFPMSCPLNLHWSVKMNRCEYPSIAGCDTNIAVIVPTEIAGGMPMSNCPVVEDPNNPTQLAYPGDCSKFYKCAAGLAFPISCPKGLHWSTVLNRCDWPSVANCVSGGATPSITPSTQKPSTASTKPNSTTDTKCPLVEDPNNPTQLPYPGDCTKFYKCEAGVAYPISCPQGLHWSTVLNRCDWPSVANCVSGGATPSITPSTQKPSTASTKPNPTTDAKCPLVEDPNKPTQLPYPGDCSKFYKCKAGVAYPISCPQGLHWSTVLNRCDWPSVANCVSGGATPSITPSTQKPSTASTKPNSTTDTKCPLVEDPNNPTQLPYPGDCSKFYKCEAGVAYPISCPQGLHWSTVLNRCDWPSVANCVSGGATPSITPSTQKPSTASTKPNPTTDAKCPLVEDPNKPTQLPYPGDCSKFYKCKAGVAYPISCPQGLHWSTVLNRCDWPSVANCRSGDITSFIPTPTPSISALTPSIATPTPSVATPTPSIATPTPSIATPTASIATPTPSIATPTPSIVTPTPPNANDPDAYCQYNSANRKRGYLPYPGDCRRFIQCSNGKGYVQTCPLGLFFNSNVMTCSRVCA